MLLGSPRGNARGWATRANGREGRGLPLGVRASREAPGKVAHRGVHRRCSWPLSRRGWLYGCLAGQSGAVARAVTVDPWLLVRGKRILVLGEGARAAALWRPRRKREATAAPSFCATASPESV